MTCKELIEFLEKLPKDYTIHYYDKYLIDDYAINKKYIQIINKDKKIIFS